MIEQTPDVVVVGGGNAALCAALAARERGADVLLLERASPAERGGNSAFAGGLFRAPYRGVDDLREVMGELSEAEVADTDFGTYPDEAFFDDLARVSDNRADPDLLEVVVRDAFATLRWMRERGVRFLPPFNRRSVRDGSTVRFQAGAVIESSGGGPGLVEMLYRAAESAGVRIAYRARAASLLSDGAGVQGVRVAHEGSISDVRAGAVVLACGGFSANPAWRSAYLGPGWDLARVRGTRFNTGDGIAMATDVGAGLAGNWSGCHATPWEFNATEFGDPKAGRSFFRAHYPYGIMLNRDGRRFVDEGADFQNYTYAKYGREILRQPGQFAWQIFDAQAEGLLGREEYRSGRVTRVTADTLEDLVARLEGVHAGAALATIGEYNAAVDRDAPFDPANRDGKATTGLAIDKSNWATPIEQPPFEAFAVTCGITFTFGGLRIDPSTARVLDVGGEPIPGLYAAGEIVGGLFYSNYPAGTGLTTGAVFGRIAGARGAEAA